MNKTAKKVLKKVLPDEKYNELQDKHRDNIYKKKVNKRLNIFHENFRKIMEEKNIYAMLDRTITPRDMVFLNKGKAEGVTCNLAFPHGLSVKDLDKAMDALSENVLGKCMVFIEDEDGINIRFSAIKKWHDIKYEPYLEHKGKPITASQMFCGYNINLEPIVIDLASNPHLMITGGSGGGKSKLVEIIISNLALANSPDDLELYFLQVAKDDQFKFELLDHCKGCVTAGSGKNKKETLSITLDLLRHIDNELTKRGNLIKNKLGRKSEDINIHVFNEKFPNEKLPVINLWVDEAASLYKVPADKEMSKMVKEAQQILERVASTGRYIGVYLINVLQRASKDELPREIKINTLNWISFKQVDAGASKVAIGDEKSALGLPQRVFCYKAGTDYVSFGKTPFTRWDTNVLKLEKQNKIREDNEAVYEKIYSAWKSPSNSVIRKDESIEIAKNETKSKSKIQNETVKVLDDKINKLTEELTSVKYERELNEEILKKLMEENKMLKKKLDLPCESSPGKDDSVVTSLEVIKDISKIEYDTADKQRESVKQVAVDTNKESNPYKELDLSKLNIKKKK